MSTRFQDRQSRLRSDICVDLVALLKAGKKTDGTLRLMTAPYNGESNDILMSHLVKDVRVKKRLIHVTFFMDGEKEVDVLAVHLPTDQLVKLHAHLAR